LELVELEQTPLQMEQAELHHSMEWFLLVAVRAEAFLLLGARRLAQQALRREQQHQLFHTQVRLLQLLALLVMQVVVALVLQVVETLLLLLLLLVFQQAAEVLGLQLPQQVMQQVPLVVVDLSAVVVVVLEIQALHQLEL
jgi:hypothetical protein